MSSAWGWFISIVTIANIAAALWLLWAYARTRVINPAQVDTGHTWDGDLTELNNPLPRWWLWLFVLTVIFSVAYLALYPGLGRYPGMLKWSQAAQHTQEVRSVDAAQAPRYQRYASMDLPALARDPEAMATARSIFVNDCAGCHGSDGRGAVGFPNLTDNDWLFGKEPATLVETITNGRVGAMPPWQDVLGDKGIDQVEAYVLSLQRREAPFEALQPGATLFATYCSACHGADARGNHTLGAPNLTDDIWLFGGEPAAIRTSIAGGRTNQMPAHQAILGPERVRLLAAYVLRLSAPASAAGSDHREADHDSDDHE